MFVFLYTLYKFISDDDIDIEDQKESGLKESLLEGDDTNKELTKSKTKKKQDGGPNQILSILVCFVSSGLISACFFMKVFGKVPDIGLNFYSYVVMFSMSAFVMRASGNDRTDQKIAMLISVVGFICFGHYILNEVVVFYANSYLDWPLAGVNKHPIITSNFNVTSNSDQMIS